MSTRFACGIQGNHHKTPGNRLTLEQIVSRRVNVYTPPQEVHHQPGIVLWLSQLSWCPKMPCLVSTGYGDDELSPPLWPVPAVDPSLSGCQVGILCRPERVPSAYAPSENNGQHKAPWSPRGLPSLCELRSEIHVRVDEPLFDKSTPPRLVPCLRIFVRGAPLGLSFVPHDLLVDLAPLGMGLGYDEAGTPVIVRIVDPQFIKLLPVERSVRMDPS